MIYVHRELQGKEEIKNVVETIKKVLKNKRIVYPYSYEPLSKIYVTRVDINKLKNEGKSVQFYIPEKLLELGCKQKKGTTHQFLCPMGWELEYPPELWRYYSDNENFSSDKILMRVKEIKDFSSCSLVWEEVNIGNENIELEISARKKGTLEEIKEINEKQLSLVDKLKETLPIIEILEEKDYGEKYRHKILAYRE